MKDLDEKLKELQAAREKITERIEQSQTALESIGEKIEAVKMQGKERLLRDDRVDNRLVMTAHEYKETKSQPIPIQMAAAAEEGRRENRTLIQRELTQEEITCKPKPPQEENEA